MAASTMGAFGLHKQAYQKANMGSSGPPMQSQRNQLETIWVNRRHNPLDMRMEAPVPRYKLTTPPVRPCADNHWVPVTDPPLNSFQRPRERTLFPSHPANRSQEWSTLRQMLPAWGFTVAPGPPNWGTSGGPPPYVLDRPASRFPMINSPMTRYRNIAMETDLLIKYY